MLKKLVKYDFVWIERLVVWYTVAAVVCGAFTCAMEYVFNNINNSVFWLVMDKIAVSLLIIACISLFINAFIRTVVRFVTTFYKDQSYFTHTLPADRGTLYASKAIAGALVMVLALLSVCAAVLIAAGDAVIDIVKTSLHALGGFSAALLVLIVALEVICALFAVYFGMVLGYRRNKAKGAWGVVFSLLIYFGAQAVILAVFGVIAALDGDMSIFFKSEAAQLDAAALDVPLKKLYAVCASGYVLIDTGLYLLGRRAFAKGVNVD